MHPMDYSPVGMLGRVHSLPLLVLLVILLLGVLFAVDKVGLGMVLGQRLLSFGSLDQPYPRIKQLFRGLYY